MPNFSAKVTVEIEADLEFQGESLDDAIDWIREATFEDLASLGGAELSKKNIRIISIEEQHNDKK